MTKRLSLRFALMIMAIVTGILCFAVTGAQESKLGKVYADTAPITEAGLLTTFEYGTYTDTYLDSIIGTYSSESDKSDTYHGKMSAYIYDSNTGSTIFWATYDNSKIPGASGYAEYKDNKWDNMLAPGTYLMDIDWTPNGSFSYDSLEDIELTVTQAKIDLNSALSETDFENCTYGFYDYWTFADDSYLMPIGDDEINVGWFYNKDGEEIQLSNTTFVGTYDVYPKLVGADADKYVVDGKAQYYDDSIWDYRDITSESPVTFTIVPQEIMVRIAYDDGSSIPPVLDMYDDYDGAPVFNNNLYYNTVALPLIGWTTEPGLQVEIAGDWYYKTGKTTVSDVVEVGEYFIYTEDLVLTSDVAGFANNYKIVNSNCKVTVNKRMFYVDAPTEEYYKYDIYSNTYGSYNYGVSYGFYTGEEVVPEYSVRPSNYNYPGETGIIYPEIVINGNSTLRTDVSIDYMTETGNIILEILDDGTHYSFSTYSLTYNWDYVVVPGYADIDFDKVADWHYREVVADYTDKVTIDISTTDEFEPVTLKQIDWSNDNQVTWNTGMPTRSDAENMVDGLWIRVVTNASDNGKFQESCAMYHFDILKAPVYVRTNANLVYNGEFQEPELNNYLFYIYEPGKSANLWYNVFGCDYDDYTTIINYYERGGEWIPHLMTFEAKDVGTYEMSASLIQGGGYQNTYDFMSLGQFGDHYEIVRPEQDPDSSYKIVKRNLMIDEITMNYYSPMTYSGYEDTYYATYGDVVSAPYPSGVTGFVGSDTEYGTEVEKHWYYTTVKYPTASDWVETDIDLTYPMHNPNTYTIKYVGVYENYADVEVEYKLVVNKKELTIKWYENEDAYLADPDSGIITGNSIITNVATYVYNGQVQTPFYVITGVVNEDETPVPMVVSIGDNKYYGAECEGINVGEYRLTLKDLDNNNYSFPNKYDDCMAVYTVVPATLTVTPDAGFSKTYGTAEDPEFTYTVAGAISGETPVLTGALGRVAGNTVGNYNITLGTVALTDAEVNANYTVELNATPVTFAITTKTITANFINTEKYYTSSALLPDFDGFTGLEAGDNVGINFTSGNSVGAGNYNKAFELTGADKDNYVLSTNEVAFSILQLVVTYTAKVDSTNNMSVEYDGNSHALTVTMTNKQGTDDVTINILTNASATVSGSYTATLALTGDKALNYKFATGEDKVTWYISKAGVDYNKFVNTFNNVTVAYDGYAHAIIKSGTLPEGYTFEYYVANKTDSGYSTTETKFGSAKNVGNYYVEVRFTEDGDHDPVPSIFRDLIIEKKDVTIEWNNYIFTYDGTAHLPEIELTGIVAGEEIGVDVVWNIAGQVNHTNGVVAKVTGLTGDNASNYKLSGQTQVSMVINQRTIKVTIDSKSSNYGDTIVDLTGVVTTGSIVEGDDVDNIYTLSTTATNAKPVGEYPIVGEQGDDDNYIVTFKSAIYTINVRPITVTIDNKEAYYGDAKVELTAVVAGGIVNGDTGVYNLVCNITPANNVNNYWITGVAKNTNYDITFVDGIYTINARPITITYTGERKSVVYGDEPVWEALGQEMTNNVFYLVGDNFVNNDNIMNSTILYFNTKVDGSGVTKEINTYTEAGVYYMIVAGNNSNYDFTISLGDQAYLLVQKAPIIVSADAKNMTYGNVVPNFTVSYTGFVLDDDETDLGGELAFACAYAQFDDAGNYDIVPSGLTSNNYQFTFQKGNLYVAPRPITVAIDDKASNYGDDIVPFTSEVVEGNIVNNDENVYSLICEVTPASNVNNYLIGGNLIDDNYDITFVNANNDEMSYGIYTINKRPITITIANKASYYGNQTSQLTSTVTAGSIVNGDANVYGLTCNATNMSDVGEYAIAGVKGSNANYNVEFVEGVYTINARPIVVTIANKTSIYGNRIEQLTSEVTTGSIVNDDENVYSLVCNITSASPVNVYAITGNGLDENYDITFVNGRYSITARVVTLAWTNDSFVYDEASHKPTATAGNLVNGDVVTVTVSGAQVIAGTYTATATALSNANYTLPATNITKQFTISKPASYDKPIDTEAVKENGVDLTQVFNNIDTTREDAKLELQVGDAVVEFNKEAIEAIAGNNAVFKFKELNEEEIKGTVKGAAAVFEISLGGVSFEEGEVVVTANFENKAPAGKEARLYYVDENGHRTFIKATFADGKVVFATNHFSTYAVVYEMTTVTIMLIVLAILVVLGGVAYGVIFFMKKKKAGNPTAKPEAKPNAKPEMKSDVKPEAKKEASKEPAEKVNAEKKDNK